MFNHIPWNISQKWMVMADEADRVYSTLIRHVVHNPRTQSQAAKLPIWMSHPTTGEETSRNERKGNFGRGKTNDGLQLNGIMLMRIDTRLRIPLKVHFDPNGNNYDHYVKEGHPLRRIHVEPARESWT